MKFNRQKRVAKQLKLAKDRRFKKDIQITIYAFASIFSGIMATKVKNDKLKEGLQFVSAFTGSMCLKKLSSSNIKTSIKTRVFSKLQNF